jgi:hypothetical protein
MVSFKHVLKIIVKFLVAVSQKNWFILCVSGVHMGSIHEKKKKKP